MSSPACLRSGLTFCLSGEEAFCLSFVSTSQNHNFSFRGSGQVRLSPPFCQTHLSGLGCSKPSIYIHVSAAASALGLHSATHGRGKSCCRGRNPSESPKELQTPSKSNVELQNPPKIRTKCPNPSPCSHKESPDVQEVAGGVFPPGILFPRCRPSKHYAAPISSLRGCREYFQAELISCCEEITGQSFPRTCSYGSGMVSQQGYLSGETEARRRRHMPETPPGCEAQPGSRDWNFPQGLVKSCCLKRAGGENKPPASLGHWECWCALGSGAVPADPITHGCWTLRAWL